MKKLSTQFKEISQDIKTNGIQIDDNLDEVIDKVNKYGGNCLLAGMIIGVCMSAAVVTFYWLMFNKII